MLLNDSMIFLSMHHTDFRRDIDTHRIIWKHFMIPNERVWISIYLVEKILQVKLHIAICSLTCNHNNFVITGKKLDLLLCNNALTCMQQCIDDSLFQALQQSSSVSYLWRK
jgi:hypothetical protein